MTSGWVWQAVLTVGCFSPGTRWAAIEPNLWSLAFEGQARSICCKYYFSLLHSSIKCELSLEPLPRCLQVQQKQVDLLLTDFPGGQFATNRMMHHHQHVLTLTASLITFATFLWRAQWLGVWATKPYTAHTSMQVANQHCDHYIENLLALTANVDKARWL